MLTLFTRVLSWMTGGLQLEEPAIPRHLFAEYLIGTVDAFQGGWGVVRWTAESIDQPQNTAATVRSVFTTADDECAVIFLGHVAHTGVAGVVDIRYSKADAGTTITLVQAEATFAGSGLIAAAEWHNGPARPIFIPPSATVSISFPITGAGEDYNATLLRAVFPLGFKVL